MDVAFLLDKYFKGAKNVSIDVFDAQTLNTVYKDVINAMTSHFEIEVSVLQALSYCLYEMMDNVHIHSGKPLGTAITYYDDKQKTLRILIADDGMGIRASLAQNNDYKDITEPEALKMCLEDKITDGKGMGFGLYTTSRLIENIGKEFVLHSGSHKLITKNGRTEVIENGLWQGTLIYMEIGTGEEIDPSQIVDHRADELKQHTTFKGLNPLAERSVLVALQRRYKVIKGS
jgi:anti-sigma regulatory factor (Ser/Thr protein kinase)